MPQDTPERRQRFQQMLADPDFARLPTQERVKAYGHFFGDEWAALPPQEQQNFFALVDPGFKQAQQLSDFMQYHTSQAQSLAPPQATRAPRQVAEETIIGEYTPYKPGGRGLLEKVFTGPGSLYHQLQDRPAPTARFTPVPGLSQVLETGEIVRSSQEEAPFAPFANIGALVDKQQRPVTKAIADFAGSLTTPENIGFGTLLPGASVPLKAAIGTYFTGAMAHGTAETLKAQEEAATAGNLPETAYLGTTAFLSGVLSGFSGTHAVRGAKGTFFPKPSIETATTTSSPPPRTTPASLEDPRISRVEGILRPMVEARRKTGQAGQLSSIADAELDILHKNLDVVEQLLGPQGQASRKAVEGEWQRRHQAVADKVAGKIPEEPAATPAGGTEIPAPVPKPVEVPRQDIPSEIPSFTPEVAATVRDTMTPGARKAFAALLPEERNAALPRFWELLQETADVPGVRQADLAKQAITDIRAKARKPVAEEWKALTAELKSISRQAPPEEPLLPAKRSRTAETLEQLLKRIEKAVDAPSLEKRQQDFVAALKNLRSRISPAEASALVDRLNAISLDKGLEAKGAAKAAETDFAASAEARARISASTQNIRSSERVTDTGQIVTDLSMRHKNVEPGTVRQALHLLFGDRMGEIESHFNRSRRQAEAEGPGALADLEKGATAAAARIKEILEEVRTSPELWQDKIEDLATAVDVLEQATGKRLVQRPPKGKRVTEEGEPTVPRGTTGKGLPEVSDEGIVPAGALPEDSVRFTAAVKGKPGQHLRKMTSASQAELVEARKRATATHPELWEQKLEPIKAGEKQDPAVAAIRAARRVALSEALKDLRAEKGGRDALPQAEGMGLKAEQAARASEAAREAAESIKNTIITDADYAAAKERLRAKLGGLKSGIDPTLMRELITMGAYHLEKGARTFKAWSEKLIEEAGDTIKPYLATIWNQLRAGSIDVKRYDAEGNLIDVKREPRPAEVAVEIKLTESRNRLLQEETAKLTDKLERLFLVRGKLEEAAAASEALLATAENRKDLSPKALKKWLAARDVHNKNLKKLRILEQEIGLWGEKDGARVLLTEGRIQQRQAHLQKEASTPVRVVEPVEPQIAELRSDYQLLSQETVKNIQKLEMLERVKGKRIQDAQNSKARLTMAEQRKGLGGEAYREWSAARDAHNENLRRLRIIDAQLEKTTKRQGRIKTVQGMFRQEAARLKDRSLEYNAVVRDKQLPEMAFDERQADHFGYKLFNKPWRELTGLQKHTVGEEIAYRLTPKAERAALRAAARELLAKSEAEAPKPFLSYADRLLESARRQLEGDSERLAKAEARVRGIKEVERKIPNEALRRFEAVVKENAGTSAKAKLAAYEKAMETYLEGVAAKDLNALWKAESVAREESLRGPAPLFATGSPLQAFGKLFEMSADRRARILRAQVDPLWLNWVRSLGVTIEGIQGLQDKGQRMLGLAYPFSKRIELEVRGMPKRLWDAAWGELSMQSSLIHEGAHFVGWAIRDKLGAYGNNGKVHELLRRFTDVDMAELEAINRRSQEPLSAASLLDEYLADSFLDIAEGRSTPKAAVLKQLYAESGVTDPIIVRSFLLEGRAKNFEPRGLGAEPKFPGEENGPFAAIRAVASRVKMRRRAIKEAAVDANIHNVDTPRDISYLRYWLGSLSQTAVRATNLPSAVRDHLQRLIYTLAESSENSLRDDAQVKRVGREAIRRLKEGEWDKVLVDLLDNREVTPLERPSGLLNQKLSRIHFNKEVSELTAAQRAKLSNRTDAVWESYLQVRGLYDLQRVGGRDALRARERLSQVRDRDLPAEKLTAIENKIKEMLPDDWGIVDGYYQHAFPGDYSIKKRAVNADGENVLVHIETGWRAESQVDALVKAWEYRQEHPDAVLEIKREDIRPSGHAGTSAKGLRKIYELLEEKLTGDALDKEAQAAIQDTASAIMYGPKRLAQRQTGAVQAREINLPGWARDPETWLEGVRSMSRFINMVEARERALQLRNRIATVYSEGEKISPAELQGVSYQKKNLFGVLARVDSALLAWEGYPSFSMRVAEATINALLPKHIKDSNPNIYFKLKEYALGAEAVAKLGGNISSGLINLTQLFTNVLPTVGPRWFTVGVSKLRDSAPISGDTITTAKDLYNHLGIHAQSTKLESESIMEYFREYKPNGVADIPKAALRGTAQLAMLSFQLPEFVTRKVAAAGTFERAKAEGKSDAAAVREAREAIRKTAFGYERWDKPALLQPLPVELTQFKTYVFKQLEFMTGLKGKELAYFAAISFSLYGAAGIPGVELADRVIEAVTGESPMKLARSSDSAAVRAMAKGGIPGAAGVDISRQGGFGEYFDLPSSATEMAGPVVSDTARLIAASPALLRRLTTAVPGSRERETALRQFVAGLSPHLRRSMQLDGNVLKDLRTGDIVVSDLTPWEKTLMSVGLVPERISEARDVRSEIRQEQTQYRDERGYFVDQIAMRIVLQDESNDATVDKLEAEISALQEEAIEKGLAVGMQDSLKLRIKQLRMTGFQRDMLRTPRALRPRIGELQERVRQPEEREP